MGQHIPDADNRHRHAPCKLAALSSKFLTINSQAVDTFLESPQGSDIKNLKLFDKEWEVLLDLAHILMV
jgi:hypothetical protein